MKKHIHITLFFIIILSCKSNDLLYDIVINNGTIYDGTGNKSYIGNIAIKEDKIANLGNNKNL